MAGPLETLRSLLRPGGKAALGRRGERLAVRHLRRQGYRILVHNYRDPQGEIDIIASKGGLLAFVEVKARRRETAEGPQGAVSRKQQERLRRASQNYLRKTYGANPPPARLDLILIEELPDGDRLEHFPAAF